MRTEKFKSIFTRKRIVLCVVVVLGGVILIQGLLYIRSTYGANRFIELQSVNSEEVQSRIQSMKKAESTAVQTSLAELAAGLQHPEGAMCHQNDSFFLITSQKFKASNATCVAYGTTIKEIQDSAVRLGAMGAYLSNIKEALNPATDTAVAGSDPGAAVEAYSKTAERVAKVRPPESLKKSHEELVVLLKKASSDAAAVADAQKIQSIDGFKQKTEAMSKTIASLNALGSTLETYIKEESAKFQQKLEAISQK